MGSCRCGACSPNRAMWARSRSRCAWAKTASTNTFAHLVLVSRLALNFPGETRGLTKPPSRWSRVSIAAISMGQEIGISPIQLAGLVSTFANDGVWVAPRIVAGTVEPQGAPQTVAFHPGAAHRVISPYTAAEMRSMMEKVVFEGTGRKAILEGYSAAGKTGTAQKVDPATGAYSKTKYIGSFAGFAPVNNPQIVVAVILDSAVGLHQGGQVSRSGLSPRHPTGPRISARSARSAARAKASAAAGASESKRQRPG